MKLVFSTRRNCRVRKVFDDGWQREGKHFYDHSFTGHNLPVTDIVVGYGGSNAIIISSSVDPTCKHVLSQRLFCCLFHLSIFEVNTTKRSAGRGNLHQKKLCLGVVPSFMILGFF
ncbi:uncharacterized protein LOC120083848 isoform X1 [Benincasa hispida]|uniref:uncharacterized protein LOC120083848 isoform X1 n=1 Tax=Benincasa hispida TaxID=102211 RepID=UPI0019020443|nr:uncharacterized protein LOC120083848 isoform X1 [Benincasa hispida]